MASNEDASPKKVLTLAEVQQLAEAKDKCILIINDHVYDITKFIDEVSHHLSIHNEQSTHVFVDESFSASRW